MEQELNSILQEPPRSLHMPEAVSWWPPAPGWWVLLILALLLIGFSLWLVICHKQKNRYRKQAITELQTIYNQWLSKADNSQYVQSANATLKRAYIAVGGEAYKASQTGQVWIESLNSWINKPLSEQSSCALIEAGYRANPEVDIDELHKELTAWLSTHKKPSDSLKGAPHNA